MPHALPAPSDIWTFRARPDPFSNHEAGVVDGDTYDMVVDMGFHGFRRIRLRSATVNTAEIYGVSHDSEEYRRGRKHRDGAISWIYMSDTSHWPLRLRTYQERGKYGRWLAEVYNTSDESLGDFLYHSFDEVTLNEW